MTFTANVITLEQCFMYSIVKFQCHSQALQTCIDPEVFDLFDIEIE